MKCFADPVSFLRHEPAREPRGVASPLLCLSQNDEQDTFKPQSQPTHFLWRGRVLFTKSLDHFVLFLVWRLNIYLLLIVSLIMIQD